MLELLLTLKENKREQNAVLEMKPLCNFNLNEIRFSEQAGRIKSLDECRILTYSERQPHRA